MNEPAAIPWYKSQQTLGHIATIIFGIIALFPKVGDALNLTTMTDVSNAVSIAASIAAVITPIVATWLRTKSKIQPITLTQGKADAISNSTPSPDRPPAGSAGLS